MLMPAWRGDRVGREGFSHEARERGAGVREGIDAHAEPRYRVAAQDADEAADHDGDDLQCLKIAEPTVIDHDYSGQQELEEEDEFSLGDQVSLAGLVDQFGDLFHALVDREVLDLGELYQPEDETEQADDEAEHEKRAAADAKEKHRAHVRQYQVRFSGESRCCGKGERQRRKGLLKHFPEGREACRSRASCFHGGSSPFLRPC